MDCDDAKALRASLEGAMRSFEVPMEIGSRCEDVELKRLIGSLAMDLIGKIDYEILPRLYQKFPQFRDSGTEGS